MYNKDQKEKMRERPQPHLRGHSLRALNKAPRSDLTVTSLQPELKAQREHPMTFLTPGPTPYTCHFPVDEEEPQRFAWWTCLIALPPPPQALVTSPHPNSWDPGLSHTLNLVQLDPELMQRRYAGRALASLAGVRC